MRLVVGAALLLAASASFAQTWIPVGTSSEGEMQIDYSSIRPQGAYIKAWARFIPKTPQSSPWASSLFSELLSLSYYDCKGGSSADKQLIYKDASGKSIGSFGYHDSQLNFQDPIPGTLGLSLLQWACRRH